MMSTFRKLDRLEWGSIGLLAASWALIVWIVNPLGEFMVNDDWSFVMGIEAMMNGESLPDTGWGPPGASGGPTLIVHLLWGLLFTQFFGDSLTVLRLSVLALGAAGSVGLYLVLRAIGGSIRIALFAAMLLTFNPFYLSQSFTFMTDITFSFFLLMSTALIVSGLLKNRPGGITLGLLFALMATLTRQFGIIIPLGLIAATLMPDSVRAKGAHGPHKIVILCLVLVIIPWIGFEMVLSFAGSSPVTHHPRVVGMLRYPFELGLFHYVLRLIKQGAIFALYTACCLSPLVVLQWRAVWMQGWWKKSAGLISTLFIILELATLSGLVDPPKPLHGNIVYDFGIGPVLLKDTYILGIDRSATLPSSVYIGIVYGALMSLLILAALMGRFLRTLKSRQISSNPDRRRTPSLFLLSMALFYLAIISLAGFHDREIIPALIIFIIWIVLNFHSTAKREFRWREYGPAVALLLMIACFSVAGLHDFMEMKRAHAQAHRFLTRELGIDPCATDSGFEFNGYHCYPNDYRPGGKLSWWWVREEKYIITLGPLEGYRVVKTVPFQRYIGNDGSIHILEPGSRSDCARSKRTPR